MVLRKGKCVGVKPTSSIKELSEIANLMVGRPVLFELNKSPFNPGKVRIELKNVSVNSKTHARKTLDDISFSIREGEILGIAGVAGNGQQPLSEVITGLLKIDSGTITIDGKDYTNKTPLQIIKSGVSHIPADRGRMGIVGDMSVGENLSMKKYRTEELSHHHMINKSKVRQFASRLIQKFVIKTPNQYTSAKFLSGGNIQKTILAREINSCRGILIAVYPSRGLDVGAIESVRQNIIAQRDKGSAILLVSEELDELKTVCDRIAVMFEGKIMDIMDAQNAATEEIGLLMAGVKRS
jgi:simple sugar transport system ATP-binding protein